MLHFSGQFDYVAKTILKTGKTQSEITCDHGQFKS
jgi:hypothetical protein